MGYKRCNGIRDCPSGNDEEGCPLPTIPPGRLLLPISLYCVLYKFYQGKTNSISRCPIDVRVGIVSLTVTLRQFYYVLRACAKN